MPRAQQVRAAEIQIQERAARRLEDRQDYAGTDGLELGREYVDPKNPSGSRASDEAYYSLQPYQTLNTQLARIARPWEFTEEAITARREDAEDADFEQLARLLGGS